MKTLSRVFFTAALLTQTACSSDWLDVVPTDKYNDETVWRNPELATQFVFNIYFGIPYPHQALMNFSVSDEGSFAFIDPIADRVNNSTLTPDFQGTFNESVWAVGQMDWNWSNVYKRIRACNLALEKIDRVPFATPQQHGQLKGEIHFLRAYNYFMLVSLYGGVPLIDFTFDLGDNFNVARNSLNECFQFIEADLDAAHTLLPVAGDKTRATRGAALALKARVLLYAASDLYNTNASWAGGFNSPELISFSGGNQQARWQAAKQAAKAVIDMGVYSLHKPAPLPGEEAKNYSDIMFVRSAEDIFLQYKDKLRIFYWGTDWTPIICGPPGYGGWGWNQVTGNMVDAYEMRDGTPFSWNNPLHRANPYSNRDPRLEASVLFEGAPWFSRATTGNRVRMGRWPDNVTAPDAGLCNYYLRKFINPAFNHIFMGDRPHQPWVHMRYAEVLLNYAEACIEVGEEAEARTYINMIRQRAGMPPITETGAALRNRYRNERRVELAFEQHRFFDVRRWMIAQQAYQPTTGVDIQYPVQGTFDNPAFAPRVAEPHRAWNDSHYFIPIPRPEMNRNPLLVQNPGY